MANPLFVLTSVGWINLALVADVTESGGTMFFRFVGSYSTGDEKIRPIIMKLPKEEGEKIMQSLIGSEHLFSGG